MDKKELTEFKRELTAVAGVDFFNPKFREVFHKYFDVDDGNAEVEALQDKGIIDEEEAKKMTDELSPAEEVIDNADTPKEEEKVEDLEKAEDEREIDKIEEEKEPAESEEKAEEVKEETKEVAKDVDEAKVEETDNGHLADELLDTRIELELVRAGIKEEKLGPALRLAKTEVQTLDEIDKVGEIIKEYPEWFKSYNKDIGMPVDESGDGLTEEEKRLKQMGIDPRGW